MQLERGPVGLECWWPLALQGQAFQNCCVCLILCITFTWDSPSGIYPGDLTALPVRMLEFGCLIPKQCLPQPPSVCVCLGLGSEEEFERRLGATGCWNAVLCSLTRHDLCLYQFAVDSHKAINPLTVLLILKLLF